MDGMKFLDIHNNEEINTYIKSGDNVLSVLGYTDHSQEHALKVANNAGYIMSELGFSEEMIELTKISGYMHDIGNSINRTDHAHSGALMATQILKGLGMHYSSIVTITSAIGHHDEKTGTAIHPLSAALILADKCDVHRNRVRNTTKISFDIHHRVNYAVIKSMLVVEKVNMIIHLDLTLDESICSVLDYFEIFLHRMIMCRRAAEILGCRFTLAANDIKII